MYPSFRYRNIVYVVYYIRLVREEGRRGGEWKKFSAKLFSKCRFGQINIMHIEIWPLDNGIIGQMTQKIIKMDKKWTKSGQNE